MKQTGKKILIPLAALALVALGGSVYTLSHSGPTTAHAQTPTVAQTQTNTNKQDSEVKDSTTAEKPDTATAGVEKETNDGPGGHQDPTGANANHQFDGVE